MWRTDVLRAGFAPLTERSEAPADTSAIPQRGSDLANAPGEPDSIRAIRPMAPALPPHRACSVSAPSARSPRAVPPSRGNACPLTNRVDRSPPKPCRSGPWTCRPGIPCPRRRLRLELRRRRRLRRRMQRRRATPRDSDPNRTRRAARRRTGGGPRTSAAARAAAEGVAIGEVTTSRAAVRRAARKEFRMPRIALATEMHRRCAPTRTIARYRRMSGRCVTATAMVRDEAE